MDISMLSEEDLYLFHEGSNFRSYQMLGAHVLTCDGAAGVRFAVWAPNAREVHVVGDFNVWDGQAHSMRRVGESGIWELFIPELTVGDLYKYEVHSLDGSKFLKADPYGFYSQLRPDTASVVWDLSDYAWQDGVWQADKREQNILEKPVLIYEVHLGSWRCKADNKWMNYREFAGQLVEYVLEMGYTHIELLPLAEHPLDASWGYQSTGYFSVTSRYGTPQDFMYLVDLCHQQGIGVILDWVPGHFCKDAHGLRLFDGTYLYESDNPQRRENEEWGTCNFDFGRPEVRSFLISNALFWLDVYHIDGLRVDAVANMLYLNYGKKEGEWSPNQYGENGNLDAMHLLKRANEVIFQHHPGVMMIAEESTSWPMISWPTHVGGMGFNFKWNMGWMNDMLRYMAVDPLYRKENHNLITFSLMYAFSENFILPLSHDEVVHLKKSLLDKMPGDYWQKFANLRAFYGYWMTHPGKKLLFMGGEFGQFSEWQYQYSLDWHLLNYDMHRNLQQYVRDLNRFYRNEAALWEIDFKWNGFQWIECNDYMQSILSFIRRGHDPGQFVIVICNFTPVVREEYRIGVPEAGFYREVFNSDNEVYGGSGQKNQVPVEAEPVAWNHQPYSLLLRIPPLATVYLKLIGKGEQESGLSAV
ncbi:1,4-alpha-glucan branching enzyme GlgB [Propionispora sp. 2/2-37]|uniref:1,4-alpha-glucan branching protein GlgB n=1 Tax=Propionispora sp. 2/2-37 TaxID=1677858 RepID=UPI0006BB6343|nr:1,4-alpha-glucan branching protein GlgB [Propionispora sp. 2/2-37]CUH95423.1 1,4-alpha-glucan branching enzyme GlgB [Propionispora sp. 2/2-37]